MGKVITVVSGKGGTGKTTTVAAVSSCLAALGHKTLCIDCDAGLKNLDISLGMTQYAVADFSDVLDGSMTLTQACCESSDIPNLFFLPAPAFRKPEELSMDAMANLLETVREEFEFCLIDAPSGIGHGFMLAAQNADSALIVTLGEPASMRDAQRTAQELRTAGLSDLRLLVNRVKPDKYRIVNTTIDDVIDTVGVRLIGMVLEDEAVFFAAQAGIPLVLYKTRRAAYGFLDAARRLRGEELPILGRKTS